MNHSPDSPLQVAQVAPDTTVPSNPWAAQSQPTPPPGDAPSNPWATANPSEVTPDWLSASAETAAPSIDWVHPFNDPWIPLDDWVVSSLDVLVSQFRPLFQAIRWPVDAVLTQTIDLFQSAPALGVLALLFFFAWQVAGLGTGITVFAALLGIGLIGAWSQAMLTMALVVTALVFCLVIGIPTGLLCARYERVNTTLRPMLDAMQTTPPFVYLVPVVMLFGIGNVPGVIVTIVFALPPMIRLTTLGIQQVPEDLVEAARAFGASSSQLLFRVQLPLALPTLMAGVNQTLMLALSMAVIGSMIAVGGLGQMVLRGMGRLDMGLATVGGLGIVLLAIVLDRLTQAFGQSRRKQGRLPWYRQGPVGLVLRLMAPKNAESPPLAEPNAAIK